MQRLNLKNESHLIWFVVYCLLSCLALVSFLNAQSCTSLFASDANVALYGKTGNKCLLGSVYTSNTCKKISEVFTQKRGTACTKSPDCVLSAMACRNGICVSEARYTGDNCISDEECVSYGYMPSVCYAGKCKVMVYDKSVPVGGNCANLPKVNNYTITTCVADSFCSGSVCVGVVTKTTVGSNCSVYENDKFLICSSDLICDGHQCVATVKAGEVCSLVKSDCNGICRKKSANAQPTCEYSHASVGEYCSSDLECGPSGTNLMICRSNKCMRRSSTLNGMSCAGNDECFSGYCNNTICSSISKSCQKSTDCIPTYSTVNEVSLDVDYCLCPGSNVSSTTSYGSCMQNTCDGFRINFDACLWNQYSVIRPFKLTNDKRTFLDTDSSLFKGKCSRQLAQYYACMNQNFASANFVTPTSFEGLDMNVDIAPYVEIVQPGSSVNSASYTFISAVAFVLLIANLLILH